MKPVDTTGLSEEFRTAYNAVLDTEKRLDDACAELEVIITGAGGKTPSGLVPDHIRVTTEYRTAKATVDREFETLRKQNQSLVVMHKKEYQTFRRRDDYRLIRNNRL